MEFNTDVMLAVWVLVTVCIGFTAYFAGAHAQLTICADRRKEGALMKRDEYYRAMDIAKAWRR